VTPLRNVEEFLEIRMSDPNVWLALGTWILAIVTIVAVGRQVAASKNAAQQTLFVQLTREYQGSSMRLLRKNFAGWLHAYLLDVARAPDPLADETVLEFLENLGYLTRKDYLHIDFVWNYFSDTVIGFWNAARNPIAQRRADHSDPQLFSELEWLYGELLKFDAERSRKTIAEVTWSPAKTKIFLVGEMNLL